MRSKNFLSFIYIFISCCYCRIWGGGCVLYIHFFLFVICLLSCSLVSYEVLLMFLLILIQHSGLDLCWGRVEKAPWKELFTLRSVHIFLLAVLWLLLDQRTWDQLWNFFNDCFIWSNWLITFPTQTWSILLYLDAVWNVLACKIKLSLLCWTFLFLLIFFEVNGLFVLYW